MTKPVLYYLVILLFLGQNLHAKPTQNEELDTLNKKDTLLSCVKSNGKWGYVNLKGVFVIPPVYEMASSFNNGLAPVRKEGSWGFIDKENNLIINAKYDSCNLMFTEGCVGVMMNNKWGYIDRLSTTMIELTLEEALPFYNGLAAAKRDEKWGYINKTGEFVIPPIYDQVSPGFCEDKAWVKLDGHEIFIDRNGKKVLSEEEFEEFAFPLFYSDGMAVIPGNFIQSPSQEYGYINAQGDTVISQRFKIAEPFYNGKAVAGNGDTLGFIDKTGNFSIPPQYCYAEPFHEGIAAVAICGNKQSPNTINYGFIDTTGTFIIEPVFEDASSFSFGSALVKLNRKWVLINKNGRPFLTETEIYDDYQAVRISGYLNSYYPSEFKMICTGEYKKIKRPLGLFWVQEDENWGLINHRGEWIITPILEEVSPFH